MPPPTKKDRDAFDREATTAIIALFLVCVVFTILNKCW